MLKILISNDDGVYAKGLKVLATALQQIARVFVVAPDRNNSGVSNSLTLTRPLRVNVLDSGFISVNGTPTDCVHLAITGWLGEDPDMVVSGINIGENLGDDVLYSGTVAAAMEGRFLGYPAIAVSLAGDNPQHYDTAAEVVKRLILHMSRGGTVPPDTILNVNVPDLPFVDLTGWEVTRCGSRHRSEHIVRTKDPRGRTIFWIGPPGVGQDSGVGTDFYALENNKVSITPLQVDMTAHSKLSKLQAWLENFEL